jgi:hypothetical protein
MAAPNPLCPASRENLPGRLTAPEKAVLETTAKRKGFKGLADFLRAAALDTVD